MTKRVFGRFRRRLAMAVALAIMLVLVGGGTALATTYTWSVHIGLGTPPTWWGASYLSASEVVDWLMVRSVGVEYGWLVWSHWDLTNYQVNVSQVGQSGYGQYHGWPQPAGAQLWSIGYFGWPGGGTQGMTYLPHPNRIW